MDKIKDDRKEFLTKIAKMYYIENMPQQEIADKAYMSRSNISRMLKNCIDCGIVSIKINDAFSRAPEVASEIKNSFKLKDVLIATSYKDIEKCNESVGALTAIYLSKIFKNDMLLGFTLGRINYYISQHLNITTSIKVGTIQLIGGRSNKNIPEDGQGLAWCFTSKLNGESFVLQAPLILKSKLVRDLLLQEPIIADIIKRFSDVDIALLQISSPKLNINEQLRDKLLSRADILQLIELEAVAKICGRYFDINGKSCNTGIKERTVGINFDLLKKIPYTIGFAAGVDSSKAVLSVLKNGCLKILVIDELLARKILTYL